MERERYTICIIVSVSASIARGNRTKLDISIGASRQEAVGRMRQPDGERPSTEMASQFPQRKSAIHQPLLRTSTVCDGMEGPFQRGIHANLCHAVVELYSLNCPRNSRRRLREHPRLASRPNPEEPSPEQKTNQQHPHHHQG
jgi:hypothetical protein